MRLCRALNSESGKGLSLRLVILDNGGGLMDNPDWQVIVNRCHIVQPELIVPAHNLGVAGSWNFFVAHFGACVIANDDVVFSRETLDCFRWAAMAFPETVIFEGKDRVAGFSTFFVNRPDVWLAMGGFDELLNPAYFEDNDCRYRLRIAGQPVRKVLLTGWSHDNSSTLASADESYKRMHWCLYQRNQLYYQRKWGGLPGRERNLRPFVDPEKGLITPPRETGGSPCP